MAVMEKPGHTTPATQIAYPLIFKGEVPSLTEADLQALAARMVEAPGHVDDIKFDNPEISAGYTYFGQFITHDITFMTAPTGPNQVANLRTPAFDLDSLYGGLAIDPDLFDANGKFLLGQARKVGDEKRTAKEQMKSPKVEDEFDLRRDDEGKAIIPDGRNDENIIISQMHLAFMRFHNIVLDELKKTHVGTPDALFKATREEVRNHYESIILREYLPKVIGEERTKDILKRVESPDRKNWNLRIFEQGKLPDSAFIPMEFATAAFRFGHSMVRPTYNLNPWVTDIQLFTEDKEAFVPKKELRGGRPLPNDWTISWILFFASVSANPGNHKPAVQASRKINSMLTRELGNIPGMPRPLAEMTLLRGMRMKVPSGQSIANVLATRGMLEKSLPQTEKGDPLWYYILREAEALQSGERLGPVGSTLVGETLVWLAVSRPGNLIHNPWKSKIFGRENIKLEDIFQKVGVWGV